MSDVQATEKNPFRNPNLKTSMTISLAENGPRLSMVNILIIFPR